MYRMKVLNPVFCWDFTLNGDIELDEVREFCKKIMKKWVFQKEQGEKTGYIHWQGRGSLIEKSRLPELKWGIHWSVTSKTQVGVWDYVTKDFTRIGKTYRWDDCKIPRQIAEVKELYGWQEKVIEMSSRWDSRSVNVIIDKEGCKGKSVLVGKMCCDLGIARKVPPLSNYKELMCMVMSMPISKCYLIDMPRALDKNKQEEFYSAIESIKDGHVWDNRYTYKEKWFDSPNVWVFTNVPPNRRLLSQDRWKMFEIDDEGDLKGASL